jgi:diguanylate cyclase (GGDEF)-like protein
VKLGRIDRVWSAWMVAGALACVAYPLLPREDLAAVVLYFLVGAGAFAVTVTGVRRHRPADAKGWYLLALGQLTWAIGDLVYEFLRLGLHQTPYPSLADGFYLAAYPLYVAGVVYLVRARLPRDRAGLLDAAIIATGVGLVYWVYMISPLLAATDEPALATGISVAYPIGDLLVFAVVVRLLTGGGHRNTSLLLLGLGLAVLFVTDTFYSIVNLLSVYDGGVIDVGWLVAYVFWAGAATHPSIAGRVPAARPAAAAGRLRLALLIACTMLAPAVLFIRGVHTRGHLTWIVIGAGAVVLFVLVLTRMSGFVTQVQVQSAQLEDLAMRDELTGLANRRRFELRLAEALAAGTAQVVVIDLTGFKTINDRHGHAAGDKVLAAVAERFAGRLRGSDLAARMGGDEFAVLVPDAADAVADAVVDRLAAALREPVPAGGVELLVSARIGVAAGAAGDDPVEVMRRSDVAMYAAKARGERSRRYSPDLDAQTTEAARIGADLRTALDTGQFRLVYQPIVELPHGRIVSVEALVRWEHPERGFVSPADFIPVAEQNGLIVELGAWVLRTACAQAAMWRERLGADAPERVSVNVSARQLAEPGFARLVAQTLAWTGLGAHHLIVEVTETAVFGGGLAVEALESLHELGVRIALDDFGTGHSSLTLLQTVPVDVLKVDKSFVDNVTMAGRHAVIATALIQVADGLGLSAVAEGVETAEQAAQLHRMGYGLAQGYHFGRPVAEPEFRVTDVVRA